jgi:hypothetical protein
MDDLYPVLVYEYNADGEYGPALRLNTEFQLRNWMRGNLRRILAEKRELRITDTGDLMVFHAVNGSIVYDGARHYKEGEYPLK